MRRYATLFMMLAIGLAFTAPTFAQTTSDYFLHGTGPDNNPPTLLLNTTVPTATTAKFRDSASVNFSGGNLWKEMGTWPAASSLTTGTLTALSDLHVWLGLKNSDDQGTQFDLQAEVLKNGIVVSSGLTRCITGIVRPAANANEATVTFGTFSPVTFNGTTDTLSVKLSTRIGTNPDDTKCAGHNNAVGLRLYFDATTRQARFDATLGAAGPTITSLAPASLSLAAGSTSPLTVTISAAQPTNTAVTVTSNNTPVATVPSTVTVPANQTSAPIDVTAVAQGTATITASVNATSATSTITVVNPVPSITTLSPTSAPSGSPATTLTLTGQSFVTGATVMFGATALGTSFVSATQLTATIPAAALTAKGTVPVTVENPAPGGGTSNNLPFTIVNGAPVLAPIGNKTLPLGSTLTFTATATDPDNDPVTFAVTPLPLPAHAAFDVQTGIFTFAPDATQVGVFTFTFSATDGAASTSETLTITVTGAPVGGVTALTGRVDDTSQHPLANLTVTLKGTALTTTTNAQGEFMLSSATLPTGRQTLLVDGFAQGFAILAAPVDLSAGVTNQIAQPFTLPPVDMTTAVTVNPNATTVVQSPTLNVSVTIPPHTAKNPDGTDYTGVLTISPVPEYGRTESRPVELRPGVSITIQPAGVVMATPVPITFPNQDTMTPGSELDLWSLSPDTGTFLQVGTAKVSADGARITTISGGVRKTAWHFVLAPPTAPVMASTGSKTTCTTCPTGSETDLTAGALSHAVIVPGVRTLGVARDLALHYRSTSADVQPIVPIDATLSARASVPQTFSARLTVGGVQQGGELYWTASSLPPATTSVSRLGMPFTASSLATGRYPYELMLFSNYAQSSIGGGSNGLLLVRNERASPFGAGWTLTGLDRLVVQQDGSVLLLVQGDGATSVFARVNRPLVVESFSVGRSATVNSQNASFVAGAIHSQARADLLTPANFGPLGLVPRAVTLRAGLSTITTPALAGTDLFVLNLPTAELSNSEAVALEQFVEEGGALLEMRGFGAARPLLLGTLPGPFVGDGTADLTVEGINSVLAQSPFGTVTSPLSTGANAAYATTASATILARNDQGPNVLQLQANGSFSGLGRAVLIGDEEIFASGFAGGGSNFYPANKTFFLNSVAFLAGAPGFQPPPPPPSSTPIYVGPPGDFSTLAQQADGTFTRTHKDGTKQQFNAQGLQTTVTDRNNNTTTYAYDGQSRLTSITDPAGQITTLTYSGTLLTSITDPANRITQLAHDSDGNLTRITYADTTTQSFAYDPQRRMTQRTDAQGKTSQYQYDYAGRFEQTTLPTGDTRTLSPSQRIAVPNVAGGQGTQANPAPLAPPVSRATFTDALHHTTTFELDANLNVTKQIDPLNRTTTITRDPQGNPLVITRPNSAVTTMTYDARGNLLTSTESSIAATTAFNYEPTFNQVTRITDPKGNQTNITYDVKGNPLTITDADNKVTTFTYSAQGLLLTNKDALNQTTTFTYDALGRLLTTTDPLNRTTTLTYDTAGNIATSTDALSRVTTFQYDAKNRLKQVTDPLTGVTQYTYDGNSNLLTVKDAKNQITIFAYDSRNRLISTTDPLGKVETYEYDGNDNLTKRITPKLDQIVFAYDPVNQLLSKTLPGNLLTSYQYDLVGNVTNVTDPDSVLAMTYDQANRLLTTATTGSSNQPSVTLTYTYDKNGNRLTLGDGSATNTSVYNVLNRLTSLTSPAGATTYAFDALSRRTSVTMPNGTQSSYTYDAVSQVQSILHKITATNAPINNADYLYNNVGNRTQLTDRRGVQAFGYDNLDRLTSATHPLPPTSQTFAYDAVGNRTSNGSLANAGNQLTEDVQFTYQYDDNGNLTRKTVKATNNFTVYTYDAENRLTKVEDFTAGNPTPTATSTYRYDGLGRRIEKVTPTGTRRYIYDGEDILLEYDGANVLQARYTHGPGIDEPIAVTKGGATFFYHQDGLGTVTDLTDSVGVTAKSYSYDAYGTIVDQTGTVDQPYTYTGRELDTETGLYYHRARYYDSATGRWLQKDPIGIEGGLNLYSYVDNNPINFTDPLGLQAIPAPFPGPPIPFPIPPIAIPGSPQNQQAVQATAEAFGQLRNAISQLGRRQCGDEAKCDEQFENDLNQCRSLPTPAARSRCYESANNRYGACRAGKPLPPLIRW